MQLSKSSVILISIVAFATALVLAWSYFSGSDNVNLPNANYFSTTKFTPDSSVLLKYENNSGICVATNYITATGILTHDSDGGGISEEQLKQNELELLIKILPKVTSNERSRVFPNPDAFPIMVTVYANESLTFPFSERPGDQFNEETFLTELFETIQFPTLCLTP